jgi:hypothetical protein
LKYAWRNSNAFAKKSEGLKAGLRSAGAAAALIESRHNGANRGKSCNGEKRGFLAQFPFFCVPVCVSPGCSRLNFLKNGGRGAVLTLLWDRKTVFFSFFADWEAQKLD